MRDWALLTPAQRLAARERFKEFNQLPAVEKENLKQKWLERRQQKDEEKRRAIEEAQAEATKAEQPASAPASEQTR